MPLATAVLMASTSGGNAFEADTAILHSFGKAEFERIWFPAPSADEAESDGLGPLFSDRSCGGCHRGAALAGSLLPTGDGSPFYSSGYVLRLGNDEGAADPRYGRQLQAGAIAGVDAEARVQVIPVVGNAASYRVSLYQGSLAAGIMVSPRLAPSLLGRASLARVDVASLQALARYQAETDISTAGVVGRDETGAIGIFGYKAAGRDLSHQIAEALSLDLGISSSLVPGDHGDCTPTQSDCLAAPGGGDVWRYGTEISAQEIDELAAYLEDLVAPAQQSPEPAESALFNQVGCSVCHVRALPTPDGGQVIAYSDLLLHDMGSDFADGVGAPGMPSSYWRTTPLLAMAPYPGRRYLHDGRAPDIHSAIEAHGGQAEASRMAYDKLSEADQASLLSFLASL